ncbi:MAG TPA: DUF433 domain-containing protein [Tepidisphaeraceae bacterium]|nr:DUF433 domain-containing protein [Tepidisphaeraceae bacterium]
MPHLEMDPAGSIHVGKTRVPLDVIVEAHQKGASAESILARFPGLTPSELQAALDYNLMHGSDTPPRGPEQRDANWRKWDATLAEDMGTDTPPNEPTRLPG